MRLTWGGAEGYSGGKKMSNKKMPPEYGVSSGPTMAARMQSERASGYRMNTVDEQERGRLSMRVECSSPIWRIRDRADLVRAAAALA